MKKFLKYFSFLLVFPLITLSGCIFDGLDFDFSGNKNATILGKIDGFKVLSYSENYELDDTINLYAKNVLTGLYLNFGILNDINYENKIDNQPNLSDDRNFDRIRVQPKSDGQNDFDTSWKWSFSSAYQGMESQAEFDGQKTYYNDATKQTAYYENFVNTFTPALEIVVMQIIQGQDLAVFTIDASSTTTAPQIYFDTAKTIEITSTSDKLLEIKSSFEQNARYIGFTGDDLLSLQTYILENVIGSSVLAVNNKIYTTGDNFENYEFFVSQIVATEPELTKSFFEPYPIGKIKDYNKTSFFTATTSGLDHIESAEYQSIIVKGSQDFSVMGVWLGFESEYDMLIDISVNYVNKNTKIINVLKTTTWQVKAGKWSSANICDINFSDSVISAWTEPNSDVTYSTSEKYITNENGLSSYYTVNNKVGVFDATKAESSYFELVFNVHKDNTTKTYYPFKVGINYIWTR